MNNQDLYSQYSWVLKVLESCENFEQVETSERLFVLYIKKWGKNNDKHLETIFINFQKEKNSKLMKLKKKRSFFSKFSHFFLF